MKNISYGLGNSYRNMDYGWFILEESVISKAHQLSVV